MEKRILILFILLLTLAIFSGCSNSKNNNIDMNNIVLLEQSLEFLGELSYVYVSMFEALSAGQVAPADIASDLKKLEQQLAGMRSSLVDLRITEPEATMLHQWAISKGEAIAKAHSELEKVANFQGEITPQLFEDFWAAMEANLELEFFYLEYLQSKK